MKKILLIFALAVYTTCFAQNDKNKNETTKTTTTKTYVKDSKGVDVKTKEVTKSKDQVIALKNTSADKTNYSTIMLPTDVNTDVYYSNNNINFLFQDEDNGYKMMAIKENSKNEFATIRPSSQKGYYIYTKDGESSFGYFNQNGNFVVEKYDPDTDAIVTTIYKLEVENQKVEKKNKMK